MKKLSVFICAAAMVLLPLQHVFSMPVENVSVEIIDSGGTTSAPLLRKMQGSMSVVAEQLLLDKDTEYLRQVQRDYEGLLLEIGDRVLTGYSLEQANLSLGRETRLVLRLVPWDRTIENVAVDFAFSGIEPEAAAALKKRLPALEEELTKTIRGASADASDWAGGVLRRMVQQKVAESLPEFKAAVDVTAGADKAAVQVIIYPIGQLVRSVNYEFASESIPNILLVQLKYKYKRECDKLRGLPVEYVKRHQREIEQTILRSLNMEPEIKRYDLKPVVTLEADADLNVDIRLESEEYKIWFEGYGDIGRDQDNLSGKAHIGKFISRRDEVFAEAELILDDVDWNYGFGYARYWGKSAWSYMRRSPDADNVYRLEYAFNPKWRLRAEHFSGNDRNEYGVRYRVHEFLSAEYVYGGDEFYLRLIGNL